MTTSDILQQLTEGTTLEGPHWTEPVKVLTAKLRGSRIEVQAVGLHTKRLWTKLLKAEDFDGASRSPGGAACRTRRHPTHFRLAAEAHRIRLAFQYDPHFAVSVSQVDPAAAPDGCRLHAPADPAPDPLPDRRRPWGWQDDHGGLLLKELKFRGLIERT